ncbi:MAG: porin family protein [Gammaproteobacteria bacterium]|nr:porin family protein [Gammaproteobacteria bacterium]
MKTILKTTLVAAIFISFNAFAYHRHESSGISPYIGGIVGSTEYTASSGNTSETKSAGVGFGGDIGLKLTDHFGIEGDYINYGNMSGDNDDHLTALGVALRALYPISGALGIFGKAGFYSVTDSKDSSATDSGLGIDAGLEYQFSTNISATLEYNHIFVQVGGSNLRPTMYALGLNYDF